MVDNETPEKICGQCAFWKTPKCNFNSDSAVLRKRDAACSEFFERYKGKEKPKKKQLKDSGVTLNGSFESIFHDGKPAFMVKNSENFSIVETVEIDGQVFYPKEAKQVPYEPYGYFEGSVPSREDLFWKVHQEFQVFIDVDPIWKDVLTACVLLSYQQEKLTTVPYILAYGDNESGKTTILNVLNLLCYRPMFAVVVPSADIYGFLEDSDSIGCILEDEIQGIHKDTDKLKIYKSGYKAGACVPRTIITNFDRSIKYYRTFCFKACASEQLPSVKGFRERFLEISMVEGIPQKEWADLSKEDVKSFHDLRNGLLKWRLASREWELPDVELNVKGRLKELWKPILQVVHGLTVYDNLFKFVEDQRKERLSIKQDTLEGKIVKVVIEVFNEAKEDSPTIPFPIVWSRLREELDGKVNEQKPNVMDTSEFFQVTKNKVGYRLREVLSGRSRDVRTKDSYGNEIVTKGYVFEQDKLKRIAKKYGYDFVAKLSSKSSSSGVQGSESSESMEKSTPANVEKDEKEAHTPQELGSLSYLATGEKEPLEPSLSSKNSKYKNTEGKSSSNSATDTNTLESRVCGHCVYWHKQNCTISRIDSEARYDCVSPLNSFAQDCRDYVNKEELVKGAVSILNGTSGRSSL